MKTKCEMFVILFHEKTGNTIAFREGKKQDSYVKGFLFCFNQKIAILWAEK